MTSAERTFEMERRLYREARLLDRMEYEKWLEMLSDRLRYFAPVRSNLDVEDFDDPRLLPLFDDRKADLVTRIKRIRTGHAHAEQPPTRVRRLISNVLILDDAGDTLSVASSFIAAVSRWDQRSKVFSGGREDVWSQEADTWRLASRTILFDRSTTENISFLI